MSSGICAKCAKPFTAGSILNALEKRWHPECFVCAGCKRQLANQSFHCKDEVPYCVNCWKEKFQPRCSYVYITFNIKFTEEGEEVHEIRVLFSSNRQHQHNPNFCLRQLGVKVSLGLNA
ncbi:hypothetical protein ACTXT7_012370 [Hymenolepis weldensis]